MLDRGLIPLPFTADKFADEAKLLKDLTRMAALSMADRKAISAKAKTWIGELRHKQRPSLIERLFLALPLSSDGGLALMSLAEALLRVPDTATQNDLILDKLGAVDWQTQRAPSHTLMERLAISALALGRWSLESPLKPIARPLVRQVSLAMLRGMARVFVLGQTINQAKRRARPKARYSYDMLGEAARTQADADRYFAAYQGALDALANQDQELKCEERQGISVKLSALHPRFEALQMTRVVDPLADRVLELALQAKALNLPMTIDAEEQNKLHLTLAVFTRVFSHPELAGWNGFGLVIQAYGKRAAPLIDHMQALAETYDRQIPIRLVKGAYWDQEIKHAQVEGHAGFPVFTTKAATDASYLACARKLLSADHLIPQFATHNAHTLAAVHHIAAQVGRRDYEVQRLHGMGPSAHALANQESGIPTRIYAPVGAHGDLLAYLVRRLLENGASASFVNQLHDPETPLESLAGDPLAQALTSQHQLSAPRELFGSFRANSRGVDVSEPGELWPFLAAAPAPAEPIEHLLPDQVAKLVSTAKPWDVSAAKRAMVLNKAAYLFEAAMPQLIARLTQEAGKTLSDGVAEVREAVDFLRYYATDLDPKAQPRSLIAAISPWNFPLAIFTGQIAAALAAGNGVLAKPAEATPLIAEDAVALLHKAGVPKASLQLVQGTGSVAGAALAQHPEIKGLVFTGSTQTAKTLAKTMAEHLSPGAPLIAETGGLNAMIVDSTALAEQTIPDIARSAFQSAGQRCSALRCLYLQSDIAPQFLAMLRGAMDALVVGDPADPTTDVGPVIDQAAADRIQTHIDHHTDEILHQVSVPQAGTFIAPTLIQVSGIEAMKEEVFGPVLHVATFDSADLPKVVEAINASGYGLTFGVQSRLSGRARSLGAAVQAGNVYVNRDQIGAVVGSQPFGGQGLSGTGPKAGGPLYVSRFARPRPPAQHAGNFKRLKSLSCPGPTGEDNAYALIPRGPILALGPGPAKQARQVAQIEALGGQALAPDVMPSPEDVQSWPDLAGVIYAGKDAKTYAQALALREGGLVPLLTQGPDIAHVFHEKHTCINTAAAGGNASLLAKAI